MWQNHGFLWLFGVFCFSKKTKTKKNQGQSARNPKLKKQKKKKTKISGPISQEPKTRKNKNQKLGFGFLVVRKTKNQKNKSFRVNQARDPKLENLQEHHGSLKRNLLEEWISFWKRRHSFEKNIAS